MAMKVRSVKMAEEDYIAMMSTSVKLLLEDNPDMKGMKISARFMLHRLVDYYNKPLISLKKWHQKNIKD